MKKNLAFRGWFYFRQGWGLYFAFILAALNTMVTTYYLAIKDVPALKDFFPTFSTYLILWVVVGVPLLIFIGYIHYKKTPAFAAEAEVGAEANPYLFKLYPGYTTLALFPFYLLLIKAMLKLSKNEKLTDEEINQIIELQKQMKILINGGKVGK